MTLIKVHILTILQEIVVCLVTILGLSCAKQNYKTIDSQASTFLSFIYIFDNIKFRVFHGF